MPVPTLITELSTVAASNSPVGTVDVPSSLDNYQRAHASFTAQLRDGKGFSNPVTLASAATTNIGGQSSLAVEISGTTTITSLGTTYNGPRFLRFTGALTLTHNATTLNLPGAANIVTVAGDTCIAYPNLAANGWNIVQYQSGLPATPTSAAIANQKLTATLATITGTATAIIATQSPATANVKVIDFIVGTSNSGAATTIAANGDAALSLKQYDSAGALVDPTLVAGQAVRAVNDGTRFILQTPLPAAASSSSPPVRQTVLSGPVDTNGFAAFVGATGSTTVTATGTLKATAAAGGDANYTGSIVNPSWTGLSTNGTMYLYLDITSAGVVTTGSTTLEPIYQRGGTYSTTNLQNTYNTQEATMKVGNGATATQVYRVFVGKVTVAGGVVTAIVWYQLMNLYDSGDYSWTNSQNYVKSHNTGIPPGFYNIKQRFKITTAGNGFVLGEYVDSLFTSDGSVRGYLLSQINSTSMSLTVAGLIDTFDKSTFTAVNLAALSNLTRSIVTRDF